MPVLTNAKLIYFLISRFLLVAIPVRLFVPRLVSFSTTTALLLGSSVAVVCCVSRGEEWPEGPQRPIEFRTGVQEAKALFHTRKPVRHVKPAAPSTLYAGICLDQDQYLVAKMRFKLTNPGHKAKTYLLSIFTELHVSRSFRSKRCHSFFLHISSV